MSDRADRIPDVRRFFVGWTQRPSQGVFEKLLRGSTLVVLATDKATDEVIGFATAISDGVLAGYIPLVEVVPEFQGQGVGSGMISRLLERMRDLYMVDLVCDDELVGFYERFGMKRGIAMSIRNYTKQAGRTSLRSARSRQPDATPPDASSAPSEA